MNKNEIFDSGESGDAIKELPSGENFTKEDFEAEIPKFVRGFDYLARRNERLATDGRKSLTFADFCKVLREDPLATTESIIALLRVTDDEVLGTVAGIEWLKGLTSEQIAKFEEEHSEIQKEEDGE